MHREYLGTDADIDFGTGNGIANANGNGKKMLPRRGRGASACVAQIKNSASMSIPQDEAYPARPSRGI